MQTLSPNETIKAALSDAMGSAAGYTNRCRLIKAIADRLPPMSEDRFFAIFEQSQCTLQTDIDNAHQQFERARIKYEAHCANAKLPAYCTYNED